MDGARIFAENGIVSRTVSLLFIQLQWMEHTTKKPTLITLSIFFRWSVNHTWQWQKITQIPVQDHVNLLLDAIISLFCVAHYGNGSVLTCREMKRKNHGNIFLSMEMLDESNFSVYIEAWMNRTFSIVKFIWKYFTWLRWRLLCEKCALKMFHCNIWYSILFPWSRIILSGRFQPD